MPKKYNYTLKPGRPTLYSEEVLKATIKYIESIPNSKELIPTVEGLAVYLHTRRDNLYEWAKKNKDFSDTLETLLALQAQSLMNEGIKGRYNSTITKLLLHKHGYSDKQEMEVSGGENPIRVIKVERYNGNNDTSSSEAV